MTIVKRYRLKPEFLRATVLTIVLVVVYRLGIQISIPFVYEGTLQEFFKNSSFHRISIFALGLMPYISAYILVEVLSLFIPPLKQLRKGDMRGRRRLKKIALFLALIMALVQGGGLLNGLEELVLPDGSKILELRSTYQYGLLMAILAIGVYLLIGVAELISKYGVGNGISILIFTGSSMILSQSFSTRAISPEFSRTSTWNVASSGNFKTSSPEPMLFIRALVSRA